MIYLTVGTYPLGFERLVKAVDDLCAQHEVECVAQISGGNYEPQNMSYQPFYSAEDQQKLISNSQFVVTHGGFGVIGDIMRQGKPLLVFPRPPGEGPNDQRPVAKRLAEQYDFKFCDNLDELRSEFVIMLNSSNLNINYSLESNIPHIICDYLSSV